MERYYSGKIEKSPRIPKLVEALYAKMPEIEPARAVLLTESYRQTEGEPIYSRRSKAFEHILKNIPIIIRDNELIVGSTTLAPRGCQTYPEYSYEGDLDLDEETLSCLDYGIASLHPPCLKPGSKDENTKSYINAMKNPHVTIIGHPDDARYPLDYEAIVRAAKTSHVLLEVNESSLSPASYRKDAVSCYRALLPLCVQFQVPILIGSDSHGKAHIGDSVYAEKLLAQLHFPDELIANNHPDLLQSYLHVF